MIRGLALSASFLLAGAAPILAQPHSPSHVRTHSHHPGHVRPDSAHHAAMHALLHGSWTGSFSSAPGVSSGLDLAVAGDTVWKVTFRMSPDQPIRAGIASNFVMDGKTLHWTQELSGAPCKATAVLTTTTPLVPEMKGRMACGHGEITFTLRKTAG